MKPRPVVSLAAALMVFALMQHPEPVRAQEVVRKYLITAPANGPHGATLSALNIQRGVSYPSIVHLSGSVEVRSTGFIVQADSADYDEDTGEVRARGEVIVKPYPSTPNSAQK
jgi:lipopolysaccharide assembly outer membrane protein LptD (OstA)